MKGMDRQKLLIVGAISVLALFLGDKIILTPLMNSWGDRSTEIATLRKNINEGRPLVDRENAMRGRWRDMKNSSLSRIESNAEIEVSNAFYNWVDESDVNFEAIRGDWRAGEDDDNYQTYECRALISGSMTDLSRFLYELETDPLAVKLNEVQYIPSDENGNQLTMTILFSGLMLTTEN